MILPIERMQIWEDTARLRDPTVFDSLRLEILDRHVPSLNDALDILSRVGTDVAFLRAAQLAISSDLTKCQQFASSALLSNESIIHITAKSLLAYVDVRQAWTNTVDPKFSAQAAPSVFRTSLKGLADVHKSPLALECMMWIHMMLCDVQTLFEDWTAVHEHASEAKILAKGLGLHAHEQTALYQLAVAFARQGQVENAATLFKGIASNEFSSRTTATRARNALANTLRALGDDDGVEDVVNHATDLGRLEAGQSAALRLLTLRYPHNDKRLEQFIDAPNYLAGIARTYRFLIHSFSCHPDETSERREALISGLRALHLCRQAALGTLYGEWTTVVTYFHLRLGEHSNAFDSLPPFETMIQLPTSTRLFALAISIELHAARPATFAAHISRALEAMVRTFRDLDDRIASQLVNRLQLLCPLALAIFARWRGAPLTAVTAGNACILNLHDRPVGVYGVRGVPPVYAANWVLQAFEQEPAFLGRTGGRQMHSIREVLLRRFHHWDAWYTPISAAQVAFVLLAVRDSTVDIEQRMQIQRSIRELKRGFGFIPKLQKVKIPERLLQIEIAILALERQAMSAAQASMLLFAESGD
jgi:hypothetical protein